MDARTKPPSDNSIGGLFHQLIDNSKGFVRAEANLYKQIALYRASKAKFGLIAIVAALFLALGGFIGLIVGLVLGLARLVGPVAAGLIIFAVALLAAYLLVRSAMKSLGALAGDSEEKAALREGERQP